MSLADEIIQVGWRLIETDLSDGTSGNISARCPDSTHILITPSGRDYRLLVERDLVNVSLESGKAEGRCKPSSEWRLHAAIYNLRSDINAIIHFHSIWASTVAVARKSIPVLIDEAVDIGPIPIAPYAPSASDELATVASHALMKGSNAVLLANHGAAAVGHDLPEVMRRALEVERLAKIYIGAQLLGGAQVLDEEHVSRNLKFFEEYRAASDKNVVLSVGAFSSRSRVSFEDLVTYSFRAGITFASLVQHMILQRLHKVRS